MKKYLDILIFTLLFFLLFSYFSGWNKTVEPLSWVNFQVGDTSYTVPAGIELLIENNTVGTVSFNTCDSLSIRYQGELVMLPESVCEDVVLMSRESKNLNLSKEYELFSEVGSYTFLFKNNGIELAAQTQIEYRGSISKVFVGLFYAPIYNLLAYLIGIFNNSLGLAILAITIILRILLLFPQHKMLVSQRKMQAIQPKIKKLQEKNKWNQQAMGLELMKLYKDEGVNPMGSCGFLIIQMPILLVMYNIIINITSLTNEFYLYSGLKDFHISQIDFNFFGLDLLASWGIAGAILALSVAAVQFIQVKLSLMHKGKEVSKDGLVLEKKKWENAYSSMMPDPELMNKFMLYGMPTMVWIFTFSLAAGVGLYWGISTLFAILQQLFVNKITKK